MTIDREGVVQQLTGDEPLDIDEELDPGCFKDAMFIKETFDLQLCADHDVVDCACLILGLGGNPHDLAIDREGVVRKQLTGHFTLELDFTTRLDFDRLGNDNPVCIEDAFDLDAHVEREIIDRTLGKHGVRSKLHGLTTHRKAVRWGERGEKGYKPLELNSLPLLTVNTDVLAFDPVCNQLAIHDILRTRDLHHLAILELISRDVAQFRRGKIDLQHIQSKGLIRSIEIADRPGRLDLEARRDGLLRFVDARGP